MSSGGGGGGGSQTVTQVQQIPAWAEDLSKQNVDIATSLGSRPYQAYGATEASSPYQEWLGGAGDTTNREYNLFMQDWNAGKIPGSPGYKKGNQNYGANPLFNEYLAGLTGFSSDFGNGNFQNYIAGAGDDANFQYQQFQQDWNAGRIPGSPNYQSGNQDYGQDAALNQMLAGITGYGGDFGYIPGEGFDPNNLVAGFSPLQQQGIDMTTTAANSYLPALSDAQQSASTAMTPWNAASAMEYMSPFVMASLQPQLDQLDIGLGRQRKQLDAGATQAGAFGDARHGIEDSLNNYYGNMARQSVIGQGMNDAYNTAMSAFQSDKSRQQAGAGQQMDIASLMQQLGLTGAGSIFDMGSQQQELEQQKISADYQNYINELMWPTEQLNMRIAALSNTPYSASNIQSAAPGSSSAQNIGSLAALAGAAGNIFGSPKYNY